MGKHTHREVTPAKRCQKCGCWMRSYGNDAFCDPCSASPAEMVEVFGHIAEMRDARSRCRVLEEVVDPTERSAEANRIWQEAVLLARAEIPRQRKTA